MIEVGNWGEQDGKRWIGRRSLGPSAARDEVAARMEGTASIRGLRSG